MRLSRYFLPLLRDDPKEAEIVSHKLMLRAGLVRQSSAGIYSWLPLGHRVLRKIEQIVREEQDRAGALEMLMPTIQPAEIWRESGRYEVYGKEMLRISDRHERDMLFGPTNEELITQIFRDGVKSYKELPRILYHIQWKFRDEIRPRFGVMRGREFLMKDSYSFDLTVEDARASYNKMFVSYLRTFSRMGLKSIPMAAESGPIGGDMSHEFIILADTGESEVYCHKDLIKLRGAWARCSTMRATSRQSSGAGRANMRRPARSTTRPVLPARCRKPIESRARGIEVGHIFFFGTKYSEPMGCKVQGPDGDWVTVQMGSYGIGVSRLVGAIIEASHDEQGIVWPQAVAPFDVGLINLKSGDADTDRVCEDLYAQARSLRLERAL